ncbi:hypothetical protein D3C75_1229200 [compost metagenome]
MEQVTHQERFACSESAVQVNPLRSKSVFFDSFNIIKYFIHGGGPARILAHNIHLVITAVQHPFVYIEAADPFADAVLVILCHLKIAGCLAFI